MNNMAKQRGHPLSEVSVEDAFFPQALAYSSKKAQRQNPFFHIWR
jgi:hypothetical protein